MQNDNLFPNIFNVTDLRYRWPKITRELEKSELPVLIIQHSTPKAVIFSFEEAKKIWGIEKKVLVKQDPLTSWRKKNIHKFSGWDATKVIRKMRDLRWNLS